MIICVDEGIAERRGNCLGKLLPFLFFSWLQLSEAWRVCIGGDTLIFINKPGGLAAHSYRDTILKIFPFEDVQAFNEREIKMRNAVFFENLPRN